MKNEEEENNKEYWYCGNWNEINNLTPDELELE